MKLRSRLFLNISALMSLALLGLLLGVFSVLLLTQTQNQAMTRNLHILEAGRTMRQEMGIQIVLILSDKLDNAALKASDQRFRDALLRAGSETLSAPDRQTLAELESTYLKFDKFLNRPADVRRNLLNDDEFVLSLQTLRDRLNALQQHGVAELEQAQEQSRSRAWLIATLLSMIGVALLLIGFITANNIARRFGLPVESLTAAAEQIELGDFKITLPVTRQPELASLTRRFGQMTEALRLFRESKLAALLLSQRRLQAVLNSINDGLLIIDRDGRLEHGNPVAQHQLDWGQLPLGQPLRQLLPQPELESQLDLILAGQQAQQVTEDLYTDSHGEEHLLSKILNPVSDEQGNIIGAVMVLRDVTEQRAFERIRSEFVLRASHELRTPVTGMQMAFGLLRERLQLEQDSREEDLMQTLGGEMRRLLNLLDDLLDFSRYQNGLQSLNLQPCDVAVLLNDAAQRFAHKAEERQITLRVELHETLPQLNLDQAQLERVLDNLLGNALRHSHNGGQIRLQARSQAQQLFISVEDNGEGIAHSQQRRIFEPFVQVGHRKGGAGLGLALCKEIIQLHGGRIGLSSHPGQGARFYLELPIE